MNNYYPTIQESVENYKLMVEETREFLLKTALHPYKGNTIEGEFEVVKENKLLESK